jgi:hypothetical protein
MFALPYKTASGPMLALAGGLPIHRCCLERIATAFFMRWKYCNTKMSTCRQGWNMHHLQISRRTAAGWSSSRAAQTSCSAREMSERRRYSSENIPAHPRNTAEITPQFVRVISPRYVRPMALQLCRVQPGISLGGFWIYPRSQRNKAVRGFLPSDMPGCPLEGHIIVATRGQRGSSHHFHAIKVNIWCY